MKVNRNSSKDNMKREVTQGENFFFLPFSFPFHLGKSGEVRPILDFNKLWHILLTTSIRYNLEIPGNPGLGNRVFLEYQDKKESQLKKKKENRPQACRRLTSSPIRPPPSQPQIQVPDVTIITD